MGSSERIEKSTVLNADRARVWRALTNAKEFGEWFRVKLDNDFAVGKRTTGSITYPGYEHLPFEASVERIDAGELFAFRWHPYAVDTSVDYASEPTTLVEFRLKDESGGTRLSVVESGFENVPAARRADALRENASGWEIQLKNIKEYLEGAEASAASGA